MASNNQSKSKGKRQIRYNKKCPCRKKSANKKTTSLQNTPSKECREKGTSGSWGTISRKLVQNDNYGDLLWLLIKFQEKKRERILQLFKQRSFHEYLAGFRLVHNNIHSQNTLKQRYKEKKDNPRMLHPTKMSFKY